MRSLYLSLSLASLFIVPVARAQDTDTVEAEIERMPAQAKPYKAEFEAEARMAAALSQKGNTQAAVQKFYKLTIDPRFAEQRIQAKYLFGLALTDMKLYQAAAFQFIDVIRAGDNRFLKKAIERLSVVADQLGNDTIINFAISRVKIADFPASLKDMLYFRLGEYKLRYRDYSEAIRSFGNIQSSSPYYAKAKYLEALAYAQNKNPNRSVEIFNELVMHLSNRPANDVNRVAAMLGRARSIYQAGRYDEAVAAYRLVPKDTPLWHDALFESSWAMLRSAKFRSVLGNMASLHSSFYDDFFMPEGLLLRGIVYLYICQFDEMGKTLDSFEQIYGPMQQKLNQFIRLNTDPVAVYREIEKVMSHYDGYVNDAKSRTDLMLPFPVSRRVIKDGEFERHMDYLSRLREEERIIDNTGDWKFSPVGRYVSKITSLRISNAQKTAGQVARGILLRMQTELRDLFEQVGFARYEMLAAQKSKLEKKIAKKDVDHKLVDKESSRSFYTRNGYEYWPLKNREYWLDEIGNIYYLGVQGCE